MIDYGKKLEFNLTMSFKIRDKELSKKVQSNMKKNWKNSENKIQQQICLWQWWKIRKKKNKKISWQYYYKFSY